MNIFKKLYCRTYQTIFKVMIPFMPYKNPIIKNNLLEIINIVKENKANKPIIITDKIICKTGLLDQLFNKLDEANIQYYLFDNVMPNPTNTSIEELYDEIKSLNIDSIVAVGGGSVIDFAKGFGIKLVKPNKALSKFKGVLKVRKKLPLFIAAPTTAGTGSEVTITTVITDPIKEYKFTINDFNLVPKYAILDAKLLEKLPSDLVATTGMDALTHAVEAYIGRSRTKETKKASLDAVKIIYENLENAVFEGDLKSKENMLYASYYAGIAFRKSYVGYVHALAHAIGGKYHLAHGYTNAIILPIILKEYDKKIYKKIASLAKYSGMVNNDVSDKDAFNSFVDWILNLNNKFNLPKRIKEINTSDVDSIVNYANAEANPLYPVPVLYDKTELKSIVAKIMYRKNLIDNAENIIGKNVDIIIDRPIGYIHHDILYSLNYGYIPGVFALDNEEQDVYVLGEDKPLSSYSGKVIAIVHRLDDVEDKWVVANKDYTKEEIEELVSFQEKYFDSVIIK